MTAVTVRRPALVWFRTELLPRGAQNASMDDTQKESLEREVEAHRERIAELVSSIRDIEENLAMVVDAPEKVAREAERLRMELKGRRAAFAIGSAHLKSFRDA